ncbi:MAG TPA: rhodanese-like domain-containing protein [Actinomycetota bacterium]|nr:rhodanese-like domain-containing protein [Actinomycetota bacterium]
MPKNIDREDVRRLMAEGAQILEVLPEREYVEEHLPGAINIPLKELNPVSASQLDREAPIVTYCWDYQ